MSISLEKATTPQSWWGLVIPDGDPTLDHLRWVHPPPGTPAWLASQGPSVVDGLVVHRTPYRTVFCQGSLSRKQRRRRRANSQHGSCLELGYESRTEEHHGWHSLSQRMSAQSREAKPFGRRIWPRSRQAEKQRQPGRGQGPLTMCLPPRTVKPVSQSSPSSATILASGTGESVRRPAPGQPELAQRRVALSLPQPRELSVRSRRNAQRAQSPLALPREKRLPALHRIEGTQFFHALHTLAPTAIKSIRPLRSTMETC